MPQIPLPGQAVAPAVQASGQTLTRRSCVLSGAAVLTAGALTPGRVLPAPGPVPVPAAARTSPVRLSVNENPLGCSPLAVRAIGRGLGDLNRYTEAEAADLTALLARREGVAEEQIVLGGILGALGTRLARAGGAGGEFVYSTPGFTELVEAAEAAGGTAVAVPLNAQLENDLPGIAARTTAQTRAVYLVNPHNPSGTVSEPAAFRSFVGALAQRTLVVVDEAYVEFTDSCSAHTVADLVRSGANVLVFRTFDKVYGLAALQLGYAIAPAALARSLRDQGLGAPHALNRLAVTAAAAAVQDQGFVEKSRLLVARERARWNAALDALALRRTQSAASFVFFDAGRPHDEVAAAFLAGGIEIGRGFPPLTRWVRISIGLPAENTRGIAVLRRTLGRTR